MCYYLFFGLMTAAKGIGLDSGDRLYYALSAAALFFVACKLCLTEYTHKELAVTGLLCLVALLAFFNSGRPGIVLSVLAIVGMKDINLQGLFRMGLAIFGTCFLFTVLFAAAGVIPNALAVHEKGGIGEVIRWGMGYSTGNVFHISYFILVVFIVYCMGEKYRIKSMLCLFAGNLLVFAFSLSYTGVAVTSFYLLLNLYAVSRKKLCLAEKILCFLPLPFCLLFSFVSPFLVKYPIGQRLNELLQARPGFSYYFLTSQPITLLGTRMKNVPNFWIIMDNGYVYFLMTFGLIAFLLFFGAYAVVVKRCVKKSALTELAMIFSFLLYGIMEQFISNAFMNISILFMGQLLFAREAEAVGMKNFSFWDKRAALPDRILSVGGKSITVWNEKARLWISAACKSTGERKKQIIAFGCAAGLLVCLIYIISGEKADYVAVPLKSLPRAESQSVLVHTDSPCKTEKELETLMERCAAAVRGAAADMADERAEKLLEFSIPQSVHESGEYQTFRIRLFQGIYGMQEAEYKGLLEALIDGTGEQLQEMGMYADEIYGEQVGKDFGTDRIEHISGSESIMIEKGGSIARIEAVRSGIIKFLTGMVLGLAAAAITVVAAART